MKYLKIFNNNIEYQAFKGGGDFITPNVSYIKETHGINLNPLVKELPLLPNINTSNLTTELISGQYYPNEANVFREIWNLYEEKTGTKEPELWIDPDGTVWCNNTSFDASKEPLYLNFLKDLWSHESDNPLMGTYSFSQSGIMFGSGPDGYSNNYVGALTMDAYFMRQFAINLQTGLVTLI